MSGVQHPHDGSVTLTCHARNAQVLTQTYFTPFGVKALAASTTAHGITSKMLLMGTHTDQVRFLVLCLQFRLDGLACSF